MSVEKVSQMVGGAAEYITYIIENAPGKIPITTVLWKAAENSHRLICQLYTMAGLSVDHEWPKGRFQESFTSYLKEVNSDAPIPSIIYGIMDEAWDVMTKGKELAQADNLEEAVIAQFRREHNPEKCKVCDHRGNCGIKEAIHNPNATLEELGLQIVGVNVGPDGVEIDKNVGKTKSYKKNPLEGKTIFPQPNFKQ